MKAPTNVYGPDGSLCERGKVVPAEWFDLLPDLKAHLDSCEAAPTPTDVTEEPAKIKAKATIGRRRVSS